MHTAFGQLHESLSKPDAIAKYWSELELQRAQSPRSPRTPQPKALQALQALELLGERD